MSVSNFSLGGAAISQSTLADEGKKPPPKRRTYAKRDPALLPEPR